MAWCRVCADCFLQLRVVNCVGCANRAGPLLLSLPPSLLSLFLTPHLVLPPGFPLPPLLSLLSTPALSQVERIVATRFAVDSDREECLVKWQGLEYDKATWEPRDELAGEAAALQSVRVGRGLGCESRRKLVRGLGFGVKVKGACGHVRRGEKV